MADDNNKKQQSDKVVIKDKTFSESGKVKLPDLGGSTEKARNSWDFQDTSSPIKKGLDSNSISSKPEE